MIEKPPLGLPCFGGPLDGQWRASPFSTYFEVATTSPGLFDPFKPIPALIPTLTDVHTLRYVRRQLDASSGPVEVTIEAWVLEGLSERQLQPRLNTVTRHIFTALGGK